MLKKNYFINFFEFVTFSRKKMPFSAPHLNVFPEFAILGFFRVAQLQEIGQDMHGWLHGEQFKSFIMYL